VGEFQPETTVARALAAIHQKQWVLPAIQREFVWSPDQVCLLFDSLLRGYPLGSFLLWQVDPDQAQDYRFYEFMTDYHEVDNPYAPVAHIPAGREVTAVLDGQQRLTALNIGLYGSHAERLPRKWANNPDAYPVKRLYFDLQRSGETDEDLASLYRFRFLTTAEATPVGDEPKGWFPVSEILKMPEGGKPMYTALRERHLLDDEAAFERLNQLQRAVHVYKPLSAYLEDDRDPDTVLNIFVRVNSGGTTLSYSDLLLSMATNQWGELDAREEVRSLVTALNGSSRQMSFTRDNVLKAALVLIDVPDIGFKVSSFTEANMAEMERQWPAIKSALLLASRLLASFGFTARTLTANSSIIPLAYYAFRRQLGQSYLTSSKDAADRQAIRTWIIRSLLKRGIWGSGLDTLLSRQREAIRTSSLAAWPTQELEEAMAPLGKGLSFTEAEISEAAELQYGAPRTFSALALLYPGLDTSQQFHEDHIHPRSRFTRLRLIKAGVPEDKVDAYVAAVNGLPNLQLLAGLPNVEKTDKWPWDWLAHNAFPSTETQRQYVVANDLDLLPPDVTGFLDFYAARRDRIQLRLRQVLDVPLARERDA
jgi:hypothetical protein